MKEEVQVAIGGNLGGSHFSAAVVRLSDGQLLTPDEAIKIDPGWPQEQILNAMAELVKKLRSEAESKNYEVISFGSGAPGPANFDTGVIGETPNMPTMRGCHLAEEMGNLTGLQTRINNDANLTAFGEYRYGAGKNCKTMFLNTLGTGLGGGLILDGKIYTGKDFMATELAKMPISISGFADATIEQVVSTSGIERYYFGLTSKKANPKEIEDLAKEGNRAACDTYEWFGRWLGFELAWVQGLLAPEICVIGGNIAKGWDLFAPAMFEMLEKNTWQRKPLVVPAQLGEAACIIGAASL